MRKDPPFDQDYYFQTLILEQARGKTVLVNDPRGLREANEKLYIFNFPSLIPPTRVTRSIVRLRDFLEQQGGQMIVKPLDQCGGGGVFHVRADDRNANSILEMVSDNEGTLVMAQAYLPAVRQGDKRILLLDGEPIGAVLRVPREDETRSNLHVGGRAQKSALDARDREICAALAPKLKADGLHFVGLDVIGGMLTEINVTSPTGMQEIDRLDGVKLEAQVIDWLERRVAQ
jgi:glutathione synthase